MIPWETPGELSQYMNQERSAALKKRKEVMGRMQQYQGLNQEEEEILNVQHANDANKVAEDDMLAIMGQASGGEAKAATETTAKDPAAEEALDSLDSLEAELDALLAKKQDAEPAPKVSVESVEAQLDSVVAKTKEVEQGLKGSTKA